MNRMNEARIGLGWKRVLYLDGAAAHQNFWKDQEDEEHPNIPCNSIVAVGKSSKVHKTHCIAMVA